MSLFRKTFTPSVLKAKEKDGDILNIDYRRKVDPLFRDSFGRSQLHLALLRGYDDAEEVDYLIANGCTVNLADTDLSYPIHVAADKGLIRCTKKLVQRNSLLDVFNCHDVSPLMSSCMKGYAEIVQVLLQNGANPNLPNTAAKTALHFAAMGGSVETVKLILDARGKINKTDVNKFTPLTCASKLGHTDVVSLLLSYPCYPKINPNIQDSFGRTSVSWAAGAGLCEMVKIFCNAGVDLNIPDSAGVTAFINALKYNRPEVLKILLEHGVERSAPDGLNGTCLGMAALLGHHQCAQVLLEAGEDPEEFAYVGGTPLVLSAFEGSVKMVQLLLARGASPNTKERHGITPLLKTLLSIKPPIVQARHDIIKILMRHGADTNIQLPKGMCANYLKDFVYGRTDLMSFVILTGYTSIVSMFLIGGFNMSKSWIYDVEQGPFSKNGILNLGEILEPMKQWVEQPKSLSHITRAVIRKALSNNPIQKIDQLPLAPQLKRYVNLDELDNIPIERVAMKGEVNMEHIHAINVPACAIESFKGTVFSEYLLPVTGLCSCSFCTSQSSTLS